MGLEQVIIKQMPWYHRLWLIPLLFRGVIIHDAWLTIRGES